MIGGQANHIEALSATTQEMTLKRDRSFTFAIDKLDDDEGAGFR